MKTELTKSGGDLKALINSDAVRNQIARALPKHITPDRFLRVATTLLLRSPKLAECSQESFMKAMLDCSSLGLEPDGRRCHLIPYGKEVQLIIDWKGLVELAKRSGEVISWKAEALKEKDVFTWENGQIVHSVNWREDRGKLQAVYSVVKMTNGETDTEVMTIAEVESIRKRSKAANSGPWVTDFEEMAKKTVIRRHSKRLTLSPDFHDALDKDVDSLVTDEPMRNVTPKANPFSQPIGDLPKSDPATPEPPTEPTLLEVVKKWLEGSGIKIKEALLALQKLGIGDGKTSFSNMQESDLRKIASDFATVEETVWQLREEKEANNP